MKSTLSAAQTSATFLAMRQTNFSDSITHGPRINAGRLPPIMTLPTRNGFVFTLISKESSNAENLKGHFLLSCASQEFPPPQIVNCKRRVQHEKEEQCDSVHLQKVQRTRI